MDAYLCQNAPSLAEYFPEGTKLLRLRRFLYGVRDAPHEWEKLLTGALREFGFVTLDGPRGGCAFDKGLMFQKTPTNELCVICIHTDDITGFSKEQGYMQQVENFSVHKFEMKSQEFMGDHIYCGLDVKKNKEGGWSIGQETYITKMMQTLGISENVRKGGRQFPIGDTLSHDEEDDGTSLQALSREFGYEYDTAAGMLVHLLQTRFDLDFSIRQLAKFSKSPSICSQSGPITVNRLTVKVTICDDNE